jgi:hypothetical protein
VLVSFVEHVLVNQLHDRSINLVPKKNVHWKCVYP